MRRWLKHTKLEPPYDHFADDLEGFTLQNLNKRIAFVLHQVFFKNNWPLGVDRGGIEPPTHGFSG